MTGSLRIVLLLFFTIAGCEYAPPPTDTFAVDEKLAVVDDEATLIGEVETGDRFVRELLHIVADERILAWELTTQAEAAAASRSSQLYYQEYRSPSLPSLSGSPFDITPDDWSFILGMDVTVRGLVGDTEGSVEAQALVAVPRPPADQVQGTNRVRHHPSVSLADRDIAWADDGRVYVHVTAIWQPSVVPPDAATLDGVASYREIPAMLDAHRGDHFERESTAFASRLAFAGRCEIAGVSRNSVAITIRCDREGLARVLEEPDGQIAEVDVDRRTEVTEMRGDDFRADVGAQLVQYLTRSNAGILCHDSGGTRLCHDGRSSARGSDEPIRVALIDPQGFYRAHELHSLLDFAGGATRVVSRRFCNGAGCSAETGDGGYVDDHGTSAMLPAFRHILQGQAPLFTTVADRQDRSAGAYEAELLLYRNDASAALVQAILAASAPGTAHGDADVIVLSQTLGEADCDNADADYAAVRDAIDTATERGVIVVVSAGNFVRKTSDECSVNNLPLGEHVIVVGGFGDNVAQATNGRPATPMADWDYDTQPLMGWHWTRLSDATNCTSAGDWCWRSSVGGAGLRVGGVYRAGARRRIDFVTPAGSELRERMTGPGVQDWEPTSCCGTSQAAPNAASAIVSFLDFLAVNSYSVSRNPLLIQASLLLQADGTRGNENPGAAPTADYVGMDRTWGAGRLKMRRFDTHGMFAPWTWGWRTDYVYANRNSIADSVWIAAVNGPFNTQVDEFAVALVWDEPYVVPQSTPLQDAAEISVSVISTATVGGSCPVPTAATPLVVHASDVSFDTHKLIRIQDASPLHGRCVWTRIRSWGMSPLGGLSRRLVATTTLFEDRDAAGDIE